MEEIAFVSIFGRFSSWLKDMGMLISVTYELTVIFLFHIQWFCSKLDFCVNNLFKSGNIQSSKIILIFSQLQAKLGCVLSFFKNAIILIILIIMIMIIILIILNFYTAISQWFNGTSQKIEIIRA